MGICQFNATVNGIGNFVVGSATAGHQVPELSSVTDGKVYSYYAQSPDGLQWEAGSGAYIKPADTLARTTIVANSDDTLQPLDFLLPPIVDIYTPSAPRLEQNQSTTIVGAVNLDTITDPGTYVCQNNTCTNGPFVGGQWYIDVTIYAPDPTNYLMQRAVDLSPPNGQYQRTKVAGTWGPWRKYPGGIGDVSAIAGDIGEYNSAVNSVALTTGVNVNVCSIAVPAGELDLYGIGFLSGGGSTVLTNFTMSLSTTSATHNTSSNERFEQWRNAGGVTDPFRTVRAGPLRVLQASAATYFLVFVATFSNTLSIGGQIKWRRVG